MKAFAIGLHCTQGMMAIGIANTINVVIEK